MSVDMTNNRVPYGLMTDEEKAALHEHKEAGGEFLFTCDGEDWWELRSPNWLDDIIYRTVPLFLTQDVIAWEKLPDWVEWVTRDKRGDVWACDADRFYSYNGRRIRIDDFPGLVQIGTCDWRDSKQRRPRG